VTLPGAAGEQKDCGSGPGAAGPMKALTTNIVSYLIVALGAVGGGVEVEVP